MSQSMDSAVNRRFFYEEAVRLIQNDFGLEVLNYRPSWKDSLLQFPKRWLSTTDEVTSSNLLDSENGGAVEIPKLPLPPLEQTLSRYLEILEPIVPANKFNVAKNMVRSFGGPAGLGSKAQAILERQQEQCDNWAYDYWLKDMYLNVRLQLPINSNPGMVFPPKTFLIAQDVAKYAAKIVDGVIEYKEMLDRRELKQERATSREKGQPLCMAQFYNVFTSYREPGVGQDKLITLPRPSPDSVDSSTEHVIIAYRNQFYCVVVKAVDRGRLTEQELTDQILAVMSEAPGLKPTPPVSILTATNRDDWARAREILCQDDTNLRNLELISKSLCIICLDEALPQGAWWRPESKRDGLRHCNTAMLHQALHGGGSTHNTPNRWFEKTVQFIISNDGMCGLCYEHSPAEGIALEKTVEEVLKRADGAPPSPRATPTSHLPPPEHLTWNLPPEILPAIKAAAKDIDRLIEDLDLYVYQYTGYGKDFIKSCRVSPDSFIQLALQLTYFSMYGHLVSTYESASIRRFLLGRVDNIRSASNEALQWVQAMCANKDDDPNRKVTFSLYSEQKKMELFELAVKKQTDTMVQNILGQGIDNHLLALREVSKTLTPDGRVPDLFADDTYRTAISYKLSTSQVACGGNRFMGYGPVVPDGYGASYNPSPDSILFCLSSFHSSDETDTTKFSKHLQEALDSMKLLFETTSKKD